MKLFAVVLLFSMSAGVAAQEITDEVDRFTGQRKIDYTAKEPVKFGVPNVTIKVRQGGESPISAIQFMISPEPGRYAIQRAQFIGCRTVDWLVDGRPMKLGVVVHELKHFDRVVIEFITQEVEIAQLAEIGAAQTVEYRICGKEGALSPNDISAAGRMAALATGAPIAPSAVSPPTTSEPASNWRSWGSKK